MARRAPRPGECNADDRLSAPALAVRRDHGNRYGVTQYLASALAHSGYAVLLVIAAVSYLYYDYHRDIAEEHFDDPLQQFKYGSTGGDRLAGIPAGIFKALPQLCRDYLPGEGWQSLGFVFEPGMDRPAGTSKRRTLGFDRIGLNCAACHVGTYRETPQSTPVVVAGMPANHLDLGRFTQFLIACALDERFNPWQVVQAAERTGEHYSLRDRLLLQYIAVPAMRKR